MRAGLCFFWQQASRRLAFAGSLALAVACVALCSAAAASADTGAGVGTTQMSCGAVLFNFEDFAEAPGNTVQEVVSIGHEQVASETFTFNGSSGSNTVAVPALAGKYVVDAHATWTTNGVKGGFDHHKKIRCAGGFTIKKLQRIEGSGGGYTTEQLSAQVGQTAEYEIVVTNTGTVPLTFSDFTDPECEAATIEKGSSSTVAPEGSLTYTCKHTLPARGTYTNVARITGTAETGGPVEEPSNEVVIVVAPEPGLTIEKLQRIAGEPGYTTEPLHAPDEAELEYEILVTNTGNVPLTLGPLNDSRCESITGGPGLSQLQPAEQTVYTCVHELTAKEIHTGGHSNQASIKGTPPTGEGDPATVTSNTVVAYGLAGGAEAEISCSSVVFTYFGFPEGEHSIEEIVLVDNKPFLSKTFTFTGSSATDTVPLELPEGKWKVDAHAMWWVGEVHMGIDRHVNAKCRG